MDGLFLRQVWAGNDAMLEDSLRARQTVARPRRRRRAALLPDQQGPVVAARSQPPFVPGAPAKPEAANFYPAGATKDEIQKWLDSLTGDAKSGGDRLLHDHPPRPTAASCRVPYSVEYQGELALAAVAAARGRAAHGAADARRRS